MTRPGVYLSSSYRPANDIGEILKGIAGTDVTHIELSGGTDYTTDPLACLLDYKNRHGYQFSVHNYFPPPPQHFVLNIASADPDELRQSLAFAKRSIHLTHDLGLDLYTVHAGYRTRLQPGGYSDYFNQLSNGIAGYKETLEVFCKSVEELCQFAKPLGVRIGVENLFPINAKNNYSIMCTQAELEWMFDAFGSLDNFGMLLDLGHLNVSSFYMNFDKYSVIEFLFSKFQDKIFELHISQNDGTKDQHDTLKADSWMLPVLRELPLKDRVVTLETRGRDLAEVLEGYRLVQGAVYGN